MNDLAHQDPWLVWSLVVALGVPALAVVLGEVIARLERRGRALALPLRAVRSVLLPLVALQILLDRAAGLPSDGVAVRLVTTAVLVVGIWVALAILSAVVFGEAPAGSWRARVPRLLRDLVMVGFVLMGAAIVLSAVWGVELAGLATALGLGSIVIGLALQDTLGSIMSGIALLSERPFSEGDWIGVDGVEGHVVEMNWRAVRIVTREGNLIAVPHLVVAQQTVHNFSRPTESEMEKIPIGFAYDHPPNHVKAVISAAARETPGVLADPAPQVWVTGYGDSSIDYEVRFWTGSVEASVPVREQVLTRIWYAAQRAGLEIPFPIRTLIQSEDEAPDELGDRLATVPILAQTLGDGGPPTGASLEHFGAGERIVTEGDLARRLLLVLAGSAEVTCLGPDGVPRAVETLNRGALVGIATLYSGRPSPCTVTARTDVEAVVLDTGGFIAALESRPALAREISAMAENRREAIEEARTSAPVA